MNHEFDIRVVTKHLLGHCYEAYLLAVCGAIEMWQIQILIPILRSSYMDFEYLQDNTGAILGGSPLQCRAHYLVSSNTIV